MIMSPLIAFLIVFVLLLIALIKLKVTPSVGLFAAAIIFGLMVGMPAADILSKLPAGFGNMMTSIGLLIVFGSIFGDFLGNSGATEELAKGMVRLFGKKNDYLALNLVGFILSIPIYFGCAYIMTAPLVTALQKISKKSMKGYVIAIFTGLMLTHSCVAPTPGPLAVAGQIGANVGWFIIWGIIVRLPASLLVGWVYANLVNSKEEKQRARDAMKEIVEDEDLLAPDPTKPSALKAFLLVMFPIVLIVFAAIFSLFVTEALSTPSSTLSATPTSPSSSPCSSLAMFCIRICLKRPSCSTSTPMQTAPAMSCSSWVPVDASPPCWGQRP